jgi:hypothetical protein
LTGLLTEIVLLYPLFHPYRYRVFAFDFSACFGFFFPAFLPRATESVPSLVEICGILFLLDIFLLSFFFFSFLFKRRNWNDEVLYMSVPQTSTVENQSYLILYFSFSFPPWIILPSSFP